ncbi:TetR family transcriptional regulator [Brevibacterium sanguinis]|uniref:TetR family transcriptional regulator n=2 Tax=Brevibacterium TaxID=1696 RepID=A0A366II43_9MICO|nr:MULTISPECIES: TetR/AcrR family transcriptional regulator [Brevibacterium]RBP64227.1 TetR family transcriptional regulator [Brevibacterium sanguinis]RBP71481.1 TetR family transcriptional regulator [Brevibacterium celere]
MTTAAHAQPTAARAKQAIVSSGLSQRQLATGIGIDESKLSKSLAGRRRFTAAELVAIATATGVTVAWLLGEDSTVSAPPPALSGRTGDGAGDDDPTPRRIIVETAWDLFARHGYDSVRIADVAAAAGVSSASIHYYFPNKSALFDATLGYSVKLAFDRQIAWLGDIPDPKRRLRRLLELQSPIGRTARSEWSIWLQMWSRLTLENTSVPDYHASYDRWSRTVRATLEDGQAAGVVRRRDSAEMTDELTSLLDGLGVKVLTGVLDVSTFRRRLSAYLDRSIFTTPDKESQ